MHTFAAALSCRSTTLHVSTTRPTEFVDITDQVEAFVAASGVQAGILNIQSLHTTCAVVINEHEPLLLSDFTSLLARTAPRAFFYRHDDLQSRTINVGAGERENGHSHCRALLLGASASINIVDGCLQRGRWQRVFFVELDGPQERQISVLLLGDGVR